MIRWWGVGVATRQPRVCMHLLVPAKDNYRVMNDALALRQDGYEVIIVDVAPEYLSTGSNVETVQGIRIRHIVSPSWFRRTRWKPWFLGKLLWLSLRGTLALLPLRADIYHAHVEHSFIASYIAASFWRSRLIFDTPELTLYSPPFCGRPRLQRLTLCLLRILTLRCDLHLTGSPAYVPVLRCLYGEGRYNVIRHIPPLVTPSPPHVKYFHQQLQLPPDTYVVLYQGYLLPDRGLDTLVRAAPYLGEDIVIVFLGKPFGSMMVELQTLIHSLQVEDRVKILPPVPYADLLKWTAAADLGLLLLPPDYSLSIRKCLPNKFFEYICAGLPVLCSDLEAVSPIVQHYGLGRTVYDLTPRRIAQSINHLLREPMYCARMHENAVRLVRSQQLSWEHERRSLLNCYREIRLRRPLPLLLRISRLLGYDTAREIFR